MNTINKCRFDSVYLDKLRRNSNIINFGRTVNYIDRIDGDPIDGEIGFFEMPGDVLVRAVFEGK